MTPVAPGQIRATRSSMLLGVQIDCSCERSSALDVVVIQVCLSTVSLLELALGLLPGSRL